MDIAVARTTSSAAFFDAAARGEFLLVRDRETGEVFGPDTDLTIEPDRFETFAAEGRGTVVSWSVVHEGAERIVVAIVQLAEGPWWWTRLVDTDPDADLAGVPVEVTFTRSGPTPEDEVIPQFRAVIERP